MALSNQQIKFLQKHGWKIHVDIDTSEIVYLENTETGCRFMASKSDNFIEEFALEKIEEILESISEPEIDFSEEEVLKAAGYEVVCESPYELKDNKGNEITGECAIWLKDKIIGNYKKSFKE
jgi:hypothetical protein